MMSKDVKLFEKQDTYRIPCLSVEVLSKSAKSKKEKTFTKAKYTAPKMDKTNCTHRKTMLKIDNPKCFFVNPMNSKIKQPMAMKIPIITPALIFPTINVRTTPTT